MNPLTTFIALACVSASGAIAAESPAVPVKAREGYAAEFALTDQHEKTHEIKFPRDKAAVFVFADQKGSEQIAGWVAPLYERYTKRIDIAGVADLPGIPKAFHGLFRREFKKKLTYPVLLDWTGEVSRLFSAKPAGANLFVLSPNGRIVFTTFGAVNDADFKKATTAIDALLR